MTTIGIIAEYNPFHKGHLYQIDSIRAQTGAKNIVIVMSGDFVQRGTPAWTDKYLRTQMALSCGADMVFELPVSFATASAETFARAGVSLLTSLGFVDGICFGSECDNLSLLQDIADFLSTPPASYEETIRTLTAAGISYPFARQQALNSYFEDKCLAYPTLFSAPNNILAIEYLKAIQQLHSHLTPFLIPRKDKGYHSQQINGSFASATAIRTASFAENSSTGTTSLSPEQKETFLHTIASVIPKETLSLLHEHSCRYPIAENDFSSLLYYRLTHLTKEDLNILDMTEEILNRIQRNLPDFVSFSAFTAQIKTKQYTYSRISRVLLHCLLNISDVSKQAFFSTADNSHTPSYVPYARLLGFRKEKSSLLRNNPQIPIITKPADGLSRISTFYNTLDSTKEYIDFALALYEKDIFASNLYRQIQNNKLICNRTNEYYCQPIIL